MNRCSQCGLENPKTAKFCMQCGNDLFRREDNSATFHFEESESFTPAGSLEDKPIGQERKRSAQRETSAPKDIEATRRALENPEEVLPMGKKDESEFDSPEIYQPEASASTVEKKEFCPVCGFGNPKDSKYCLNCGAPIENLDEIEKQVLNENLPDNVIPFGTSDEYVFEPTTLAPTRPTIGEIEVRRERPRRVRARTFKAFEWGAQEWIALIIAALAVAFLLWFFVFGGVSQFTFEAKKIREAGKNMLDLSSFEYALSGSSETRSANVLNVSGFLRYQRPDRSEALFELASPASPSNSHHVIRIDDDLYSLEGGSWKEGEGRQATAEISGLWKDFRDVENLGRKRVGELEFYNYKYRIPAKNLASVFRLGSPEGSSDAVVEILIDTARVRIHRIFATVYSFPLEGQRTTLKVFLDLSRIDAPLTIKKPI